MEEIEKRNKELLEEIEKLKRQIKALKSKKKYGLVWDEEKEPEQIVLDCQTKIPILTEVHERRIIKDEEKPMNILIEGDNYHALSVLNYTHKKKIDVIYIDPPYNTGSKDFMYNDKWVDVEDSYRHSKWLNFMNVRLKLAKNLLSDKGVLIVSIGEDELANLILLLKENFNFVSEPLVWLSKSPMNQNKITKTSAICHEYIIVAAKKEIESKPEVLVIDDENGENANIKADRYPLGIFLSKDLDQYPVLSVDNRNLILIPPEDYKIGKYRNDSYKGHRFQKRTYQEGHGSERYIMTYKKALAKFHKDKSYLGVFLNVKDRNNLGVKFVLGDSYFQSISQTVTLKMPSFLGHYQGGYPGFPTAKPTELIKRLIRAYSDKDSIILDFFAGSGTTGQAVLELNEEDGGNRQFILCNTNENNIFSDICYPRLKDLIDKEEE